MKQITLFLVFLACLLTGCSGGGGDGGDGGGSTPADKLTLTGDAASGHLNFTSSAATKTLTFEASKNWQIKFIGQSEAASWCRLSATSGAAGTQSVKVSVDENGTYDERNASINITLGNITKTVVVTQKPETALLLSCAKVEVDGKGGQFTIDVQANVKYMVTIAAQYADWLKKASAGKTRALTQSSEVFEVSRNATGNLREGEIVFTSPEGLSETVHVYQKTDESIVLSDNEIYVPYLAGTFQIEVSANVDFDYTITSGGDWLHRAGTRSMSTHTVNFSYDAYDNTETNRMATVEFKSANGIAEVLTVYQTYKGAIVINSKVIDISAAGGTVPIKYSANREMSVRLPKWIKTVNAMAPKTRAMDPYELWVDIEPNKETEARSGVIEFVDKSTREVLDEVTVNQEGLVFSCTSSLQEGDFYDARTHIFTIDVTSNADYTIELPDNVTSLGGNRYQLAGNTSMSISTMGFVKIKVDGKTMKSYQINQESVMTPEVELADYNVGSQGGGVSIVVKCNSDMECKVSESSTWLKLNGSDLSNINYEVFSFNADANNTKDERQAVIELSTAGGAWTKSITVTQAVDFGDVETENNVSVTEPGSLADNIDDAKLLTIENLSVAGNINSSDIAVLKKMATNGKLKVLDMTNSVIKADGKVKTDNTIGDGAFADTKLEIVKLPATVTKMGASVFVRASVKYVKLPSGLLSMDYSCFRDCPNLSEIEFPGTLKEIPDHTCIGTPKLLKVTLNGGLEKIGYGALARSLGEDKLNMVSELTIPGTVKEIGQFAFVGSRIRTLTIPASVETIRTAAFDYNPQLLSVVFEGAMDTLPPRIFANCRSLSSIQFPKGLKVIDREALYATNFQKIVIPEGVEEIGKSALESSGFTSLTLPSTLKKIGESAFGWHRDAPWTVVLPASVEEIGKDAFHHCDLTAIDCRMTTPPNLKADIVDDDIYPQCTLYVPAGCADKYRQANYWKKFTNIKEK